MDVEADPERGKLLELPVTAEASLLLRFGEGSVPLDPTLKELDGVEEPDGAEEIEINGMVSVDTKVETESDGALDWLPCEPCELLDTGGAVPPPPVLREGAYE